MDNIFDNLKSSISKLRLKHDKESFGISDFLCGILKPLETKEGGVTKIGQLTLTYGNTIQAILDGKYAGLQCTSMALTAIIHNAIRPKFTPRRINKILLEGDRLHTFLRDSIRLSGHVDGKVAVEDIPHTFYVNIGKISGRMTAVKLRQECQYVFTSKLEGFDNFLTIKEYLQKWHSVSDKRIGFLVSIRDSSYAIILKKNGKIVLFDSHGHLKLKGEIIKEKASTLKFPSLEFFEGFIIDMYGLGEQAVIAPVSVSFNPKEYFNHKEFRKAKQLTKYTPIFLTTHRGQTKAISHNTTAEDVSDDNETSPFIGLMGSGS